ncbi:MAG: TolC family protein [Chitinophagaceae bacterium]|nr:TolC family protein [Chitinophagaceae bacterium]
MNYSVKKMSGIFSLLLLGFSVQAQNNKNLSLDEAIKLGVDNSKQLRQSAAKIAAADASLRELKDRRLPSASISGSYLRVSKPTINLLMNTGGSNSGGSGEQQGGSAAPNVKEAMYALGNVSYTLFDGFKNSAAIKSARYLQEATQLDAETDRQQVVQNIISAYSNLYKANSSVSLVKENLKQAHQRTVDFDNLEKNGLLARNDLLKAKLQESNVQLSLLDAESELHVANLNMDLLLGLPEETVLLLDTAAFRQNDTQIQGLPYWEQEALNNRSDFKAIDLRQKAAYANIKSAKGGYYPSLSLTGGYVALNVPHAIQVTDAWNGGIGLRYNISSLWKTGAEISAAKAQLMQTQAAQALLNDNIKVQLYQSYESYLVSLKKIEVLNVAVEQANENYKILKNKYDNSLATTTDLLDADVQQLQAKLNYAYAKADAVVAYNKLLQTAGLVK